MDAAISDSLQEIGEIVAQSMSFGGRLNIRLTASGLAVPNDSLRRNSNISGMDRQPIIYIRPDLTE